MSTLADKLAAIASVGAISSIEDLATIREAAAEIAIASNTVQAATMLALTTAEKFTEYERRNDELLQRISDEVEAHRATKDRLEEALKNHRSRSLSYADAENVWRMSRMGLDQSQIACAYHVNQGRVNEVLKGQKHVGSEESSKRPI